MTFAQRRNRLTTHFSERIPVVKRRMTEYRKQEENQSTPKDMLNSVCIGVRIFSTSQCSLHAYSSSPHSWWWREIV